MSKIIIKISGITVVEKFNTTPGLKESSGVEKLDEYFHLN